MQLELAVVEYIGWFKTRQSTDSGSVVPAPRSTFCVRCCLGQFDRRGRFVTLPHAHRPAGSPQTLGRLADDQLPSQPEHARAEPR